jgi:type IV secretory pathway ATPase VirB11/archaellum biosynthesis ATPase
MVFKKEAKLYDIEVRREAGEEVLYINFIGAGFVPSIAETEDVFSRVVDGLVENPGVSRVVLVQQRNYSYDFGSVSLLLEISQLYNHLVKEEKILSSDVILKCQNYFPDIYNNLSYILGLLKVDPILCYYEAQRLLKTERDNLEKIPEQYKGCEQGYIKLIEKVFNLVRELGIIKQASVYLESYKPGSREIYSLIFRPDILPNFTFTRLAAVLPEDAEMISQYDVSGQEGKSAVTIFRKENDSRYYYHLIAPEYTLSEEHHYLLNLARSVMIEHRPKAEEFTDPERTRSVFFNIARDLLQELARNKKISLAYKQLNKLASILVRYTIGFGVIEILLQDPNIQDIAINSPIGLTPIFVRHSEYDECVTNIIPSEEDAESWAAKFRMLSGRPLDEANPILDTDLLLDKVRARVAIIQQPLSPYGLAYSFRRHREDPWTLPLYIKNKMLDSLTAGLLSFLVDGSRTLLVAGTRGAGKTSLLGSLMLEILPKYRIIVAEDTLELPVDALRKIGYDILRMKVRSALLQTTTEISAAEGIRTSLRLGDSSLIIGEVRSDEAKALYEAMRVGALANTVAGTIHGASPYGVFDRVVNDLNVPTTSFKATDLVLVCNPIKSPDGLHSWRRVTQLTEVRKHWKSDPLEERGFVDLLRYNVEKDRLEASDELINGESEIIKAVATNVKGWAGDWDAVYDNILLRARVKEEILNMAEKSGNLNLLEANFNFLASNAFHQISDKIREEVGIPEGRRVLADFQGWLKKYGKKI